MLCRLHELASVKSGSSATLEVCNPYYSRIELLQSPLLCSSFVVSQAFQSHFSPIATLISCVVALAARSSLSLRQRAQIYALNEVMTAFEHRKFQDFCDSRLSEAMDDAEALSDSSFESDK